MYDNKIFTEKDEYEAGKYWDNVKWYKKLLLYVLILTPFIIMMIMGIQAFILKI